MAQVGTITEVQDLIYQYQELAKSYHPEYQKLNAKEQDHIIKEMAILEKKIQKNMKGKIAQTIFKKHGINHKDRKAIEILFMRIIENAIDKAREEINHNTTASIHKASHPHLANPSKVPVIAIQHTPSFADNIKHPIHTPHGGIAQSKGSVQPHNHPNNGRGK